MNLENIDIQLEATLTKCMSWDDRDQVNHTKDILVNNVFYIGIHTLKI